MKTKKSPKSLVLLGSTGDQIIEQTKRLFQFKEPKRDQGNG